MRVSALRQIRPLYKGAKNIDTLHASCEWEKHKFIQFQLLSFTLQWIYSFSYDSFDTAL